MKKSIYSLLLMGIIQFTIMNAQTDTLLSCYPMSIGNIWQYKLSHHKYGSPIADQYYTVTVRADTVIDGKVYQIFSSTLSSSDYKGIYPPYQRIDTSSMVVYAYDTSAGGKEYLMDSLLAGSSSTRYRFNNYPAYYSTFYQFVTEFGTVRNVRVLWTWILSETEVFAVLHEYPGIGIIWSKSGSYNGEISFNTDWFSDSLVYAKIDTKEYGTLVSVKREKYSPKLYSLNQNYPNPFNPTTVIQFNIQKSEFVELTVYDIQGRIVSKLLNAYLDAGNHNVSFNGANISSGVYYYQLTAGDFISTKKMVVIK